MSNRTTNREYVIGVFDNQNSVQNAIEQLRAAGFNTDDISVLVQDKGVAQDIADNTGTEAGQGAATGAVTGGILGGLAGLLVGIGALAIPGIGPVLAAGPLAAALGTAAGATATGAALGAGTGAIAGALIGLGIPDDEAAVYEEQFRNGHILLTVPAGGRYAEAQQILSNAGAINIESGSDNSGMSARTTGTTGTTGGYAQTSGQTKTAAVSTTDADVVRVPVVEESLTATKQAREAGQVEIRKNVVEEQVSIPVELRHEEVTVTRHNVDRPLQAGEAVLGEGDVIRVPVHEEVASTQKEARVTGEVEVRKQVVAEQHTVSDTVRREEVDVDTAGGVETRDQNSNYSNQ